MLSVKQVGIKYHFLSFWYDSTRDWTQVFRAIGKHSNRMIQFSISTLAQCQKQFCFKGFSLAKVHRFSVKNSSISKNSVYHKYTGSHFYFKLFSLISKVKCFQVLLYITNNSIKHQSFIYTQLNYKTVLFLTIQFSISYQFSPGWPIDRTLSDATTLN